MKPPLLFFLACCLLDLLVVAKAAPQCKIKSDGLWTMKEQMLNNFLPREFRREFYRYGLGRYFGDHVDWANLEAFRISESKLKPELVEVIDEEFSHFLEWVQNKSHPPVEPYEHWQFFRAPDNVNDLWISEVSLASDHIVHGIDKVNMILNGGVFSTESHRFWQYSSSTEKAQLWLLRQLSKMVHEAKGYELVIPEFLTMARNEGFQKSFMEELDTSLHHQVACLYPDLAAKNLTFFNTIMRVVPEDELVKFIKDIVTETFKAINSLEAEFNLKTVIEAVKKTFPRIDFNQRTSKIFLTYLKARSLALGVDVHEVFTRLDRLSFQIGQGWWRVTHGQWPEMLQFMTNLFNKTIKSERFWQRLDEVYSEMVASYKVKYQERAEMLEEVVGGRLRPYMLELLDKMRRVQVKDEPMVKQLISWIEKYEWMNYVDLLLDSVISTLSKSYLACFTEFYGKPDFNGISAVISKNSLAQWLHSIVVTDWPEAQPVPEGLPQFVEQLQETVLLLYSAVLGECAK